MKKYLSLFIFLIAVVTLVVTGCGGTHGYGTDAVGDNPPLYPPTVLTADDDGAIAEAGVDFGGEVALIFYFVATVVEAVIIG